MIRYLTYILFFLSVQPCRGQEAAVYNLNKHTGLSSNHVYTTLVDKHGYLWIGTTNGLYKYNGYTLRKFDYTDGLSNLDIWDLYMDRKGRVWLSSISHQFGYVENLKYHKVSKNVSGALPVIYPSKIVEFGDSLVFLNKQMTQINQTGVSVVRSDTIYRKLIRDYTRDLYPGVVFILGPNVIEICKERVYVVRSADYLKIAAGSSYQPNTSLVAPLNVQQKLQQAACAGSFGNEYIYYLDRSIAAACFYSYKKNKVDTLFFTDKRNKNEPPVHMYEARKKLHVITPTSIYILDTLLQPVDKVDLDSLYGFMPGTHINSSYFTDNPFWGYILSTENRGLYISYRSPKDFTKKSLDLDDYKYVGRVDDSTGFWWNKQSHLLKIIRHGATFRTFRLNHVPDIIKIVPFDSTKSLLLNNHKSSWLGKNGEMTELVDGFKYMVYRNKSTYIFDEPTQIARGILIYIADAAAIDSNSIYAVGASYNGINKVKFNSVKSRISVDSVYYDRYNHIEYNALNKLAVVYTSDKLLLIDDNLNRRIFLANDQLQRLGINGIERVLLDNYNNIFIKDYDKLVVFNPDLKKAKQLFKNYRLEDAIVDLNNNQLSIAGTFGVIRCNVSGLNQISDVSIYPNIKKIYYNFVNEAQFSTDDVLLLTDKGPYLINTKAGHNDTSRNNDFKLTISYDSTLFSLHAGDTFIISPTTSNIGIDAIKPTGAGNLELEYSINGSTYVNSGQQIILPHPQPNSYNAITVIPSDQSWQGKPIRFYLYIEPKWWQTPMAKKIIFLLSLFTVVGLIYVVIVVTRRIVNQNNDRRNQRRELELKSIYSQINPHFIFNSLSTAQYFVKKNRNREAYEHINQFSSLLRAYIKSSRNKYISIAEEITNLKNYLQLQLTRFEEKFDYNIQVDNSINPNAIKIPSLLLQPIVENALNHGIFHNERKGLLNISFAHDEGNENTLVCTVDDNGVGRKISKEIRSELIKKADSYGTILIRELIDTFNKYEKIKIGIEYIDKAEPDTGTTVIIKIENYSHV